MITQEMINAKIKEIEEPLITENELAAATNITKCRINYIARNLGIAPYKIYDNGKHQNAYDKNQAIKIINNLQKAIIRKIKLTVDNLT